MSPLERPAPEATASEITILGGNPSPEELAAVTAVISGMLEELAGEHMREAGVGQSAWQRSQRPIRGQQVRGAGSWRAFSG